MSETLLRTNGVEICAESFGDPSNPTLLLIMGASASMTWWDRGFCERLAARDRRVIRFDHRDVGRSTAYPPGEVHYDVLDMMEDAIGVLDAYGVNAAHWVGMSLGGMIAQLAAMRRPERVTSITAIASGVWADRPDLPGIDPTILAYHARATTVDWQDPLQTRDYLVGGWRLLNGPRHPFDEEQAKELAEIEMRRARSLLSMFNHAQLGGGEELYGRVGEIRAPALVIHGTADPVLPYPHGQALAAAIPGARLLTLEGAGHEIHRDDWTVIVDAIVEHTAPRLAGR
jgi:pimeloyl-ACP methyl ester carboxylesterase